MRQPHAQWLTVHTADIDHYASIEIVWQTAPNTLNLLLFRIKPDGVSPRLVTEETGPYGSLAELRHQLCKLFGELIARRVCHPYPWLPPGIPIAPWPTPIDAHTRSRPRRSPRGSSTAAGPAARARPRSPLDSQALTTPPSSNLSID